MHLFRIGLLLGFAAVFLQIAVFLQPLLPKQYQIAPVCETITRALLEQPAPHLISPLRSSGQYFQHQHQHQHQHHTETDSIQHRASKKQLVKSQIHASSEHDNHDLNHQCQYCTVLGHLILPPELNLKPILDRIQVRLIAFQKAFKHVYYVLHRLFLLPQGRAPPLFA